MKRRVSLALVMLALLACVTLGAIACKQPAPKPDPLTLTVAESEVTFSIDDQTQYTLDYTVTGEPDNVYISCDKTVGFTRDGNELTFTDEGTYTFVILAVRGEEQQRATVEITVTRDVRPELSLTQTAYEHDRFTGGLAPLYTVAPSDAVITVEADADTGVSYEDGEITFSRNGTFELTLVATYGRYTDRKSITVEVYNRVKLAGEGTEESPYLVTSGADLQEINTRVYALDYFEGVYFEQTQDIDLADFDNWNPVGSLGVPFGGIYDGAGFEVSNLTIESKESHLGLFGFVTGTVKNVTVRGSVTGINEGQPYAHAFAAGIAGAICNNARLINCINYATVTGDSYVGGIVGEVKENDYLVSGLDFSVVDGCVNYGTVKAYSKTAINENALYFGGIAGRSNGIIRNCTNHGEVVGNAYADVATREDEAIGGIVGYIYIPFKDGAGPNSQMNYIAVENCTNNGAVTGTRSVGGIVGTQIFEIKNCTNNGTVTGEVCVGGIVGISGTSGTNAWGITHINTCTNTGAVHATQRYAGGIVGWTYCDVTDCDNTGTVGVSGNVSYGMGGIVGYKSAGHVRGCDNVGAVFAGGTTGGNSLAGGIVGVNHNGDVTDCTNAGTVNGIKSVGGIVGQSWNGIISGCENKEEGAVSALYDVGGIAGRQEAVSTLTTVIHTCVNRASVTGTGDSTRYGFVGGIVGMHGSLIKVYDCDNYGAVSAGTLADELDSSGVGGISGATYSGSVVEQCENNGTVTATAVVGGIVGTVTKQNGTVADCVNRAVITATLNAAGGIAGISYGTITGCENSAALGSAYAQSYWLGGIVGIKYGGTLTDSHNTGAIATAFGSDSTNSSVGGVVGYNVAGAITGCSNAGPVAGVRSVGGIAGRSGKGAITGCSNEASAVISANINSGGITGLFGDAEFDETVRISDCTNLGTVLVRTRNAGGIAGYSYAYIAGCTNSGVVGSSEDVAYYIGGIVGQKASATVTDSHNTGAVFALATANSVVGGIVGENLAGAIEDCTNSGVITGRKVVGGIVGRAKLPTQKDDKDADVIVAGSGYAIVRCENTENGTVNGLFNLGGIAGRIEGHAAADFVTVDGCINRAAVTGEGDTTTYGFVGGIVGMHGSYNLVKNSENYGAISGGTIADGLTSSGVGGISGAIYTMSAIESCKNGGSVTASAVAGGIVGHLDRSDSKVTSSHNLATATVMATHDLGGIAGNMKVGTIELCTNAGKVGNGTDASYYVGGIVGAKTNGTVTDSSNSGQIYGVASTNCATGGIVGDNIAGDVTDCENSGTVQGTGKYVGGICGRWTAGTVSGSDNTGSISGSSTSVAGIIGYMIDGAIEDCTNAGAIEGKAEYVAGIVGYIGLGSITDCDNLAGGTVTGPKNVAGITGYVKTTTATTVIAITRCTNAAPITATETGHAAGIAGMLGSYNTVTDCTNRGEVSGKGASTSGVGGIVATTYSNSTVSGCVNMGAISSPTYVGGIIGCMTKNTTTLKNSENSGVVTATVASGDAYAGGIVGYTVSAKIEGNINKTAVVSASGVTKVGSIYGHSTVTIAADANTDATAA